MKLGGSLDREDYGSAEEGGRRPEQARRSAGALVAYQKPDDASVSDLFKGDEAISAAYLDLGKVQVFFFTLIVAFAYVAAVGALLYGGGTCPPCRS